MQHGAAFRSWWGLAVVFVVLGVIPLGVLAYLVEDQATRAVRTEARSSLSGTTSLTALFLQEQLRGVEEVMDSYGQRLRLRDALVDPGGVDRGELLHHVRELQRARSDILNVAGIADTEGAMLAGTGKPVVGMDFSERDWHRGVMRTGRTYVSEAIVGASQGSPLAIAIATPVRDDDGRIIAILVVGYPLDNLQAFVENFAEDQGVDLTVTDQRGVLIARPGSPPTTLDSLAGDARVRSALAGRSGTAEEDRDAAGESVLSSYAPVPDLGWAVVAELPQERAYAQVDELHTRVILIAAPLALLFVFGGALIARTLRSRDLARDRAEELASINTAVLEASREGVALVDAGGRPLLRNRRMLEIMDTLGVRPTGEIYRELVRLAPAVWEPHAFRAAAEALGSDPDLELTDEFTVTASDRSFHRYTRPIHNDAGVPLGRLFVIRETTDERHTQAALAEARDEAERANAAKTEFLSRMSHELRTPLHAVLGFGELLEREGLAPAQHEKVEQMTNGGRHLLGLITEVLDLSRIERGELSLSMEPVGVEEVVEETLSLIAPLAAARSVNVHAPAFAEPGLCVLADRQRLRQTLLNLLSNAVKYNREGGEVTVTCTRTDAAGLRVEVADTGPGIPPDKLRLVFEEFERLGAEASEVEGTGLGLALCKRLVEAMGGQVGVRSELGRGSTFWVEMTVTTPAVARRAQLDGDLATRPERVRSPARTVLLVEDNPANVSLVKTILSERPSVSLFVATNGSEAIDLARKQRPSLVLLDLNLPDMSGKEVLNLLRSDERTSGVPVVMVSADATPGQVERLLAAGADDYLTKPFDVDTFLAVVDGLSVRSAGSAAGRCGDGNGNGNGQENGVLDAVTLRALHDLAASPNVGPSAMRDLVQVFFVDAASRLDLLETAIREEDVATVTRESHAIRSGSSGIGAQQVSEICRRLEEGTESEDLAGALLELRVAIRSAHRAFSREFGFHP